MPFWKKHPLPYLCLQACWLAAPANRVHGNRISLKAFDIIEPGKTTEQQVLEQLGKPVITQDYGPKSWIYVEAKAKTLFSRERNF